MFHRKKDEGDGPEGLQKKKGGNAIGGKEASSKRKKIEKKWCNGRMSTATQRYGRGEEKSRNDEILTGRQIRKLAVCVASVH